MRKSLVYSRHKDSITALLRVPHHVSELFAQDMDQLLDKKMTFDEAINSPDFRLMAKQRLKQIQREIFDQLAIRSEGAAMSEFNIDISNIIDEVARRHKIRLADDDPILATVTITDIVHKLFAEHLKTLSESVANQATDRLAAQIETGRREIASEMEAAKGAVSKLINDAGAWSAENLKQASAGVAEDIKAAVAASLVPVQADINAARKAKNAAIWAAVLAVLVGGVFLGGGIGFWLAGH